MKPARLLSHFFFLSLSFCSRGTKRVGKSKWGSEADSYSSSLYKPQEWFHSPMWFAKPDSSYQQSTSLTLRRKPLKMQQNKVTPYTTLCGQPEGFERTKHKQVGDHKLNKRRKFRRRGSCSGKSCQLSVQHAWRKSVTVVLRHFSVSLFPSVTDSLMSLIYDAVDACTAQARASTNGLSQFDFARATRYFSRNKTGCHFTRHDCSAKLYFYHTSPPYRCVTFCNTNCWTTERINQKLQNCAVPLFSLRLTRKQDVLIKIHFLPHKKIFLAFC